jgi:hypothetical protein
MNIDDAKKVLIKGTDKNKRIEKARDNKFVTVEGKDSDEHVLIEALDSLIESGRIKQLPAAGQFRTTVAFKQTNGETEAPTTTTTTTTTTAQNQKTENEVSQKTSVVRRQQIKPSWDLQKVQKSATKMVAMQISDRLHFLESHRGDHHGREITAMDRHAAQHKAEELKKCGVNSPIELVRHIAEFETNMHGATTSIQGDEKCATLFNENPTVWLEAKKLGKMTGKQEEKMLHHYKKWIHELADAFEYTAQVDMMPSGSQITFSLK